MRGVLLGLLLVAGCDSAFRIDHVDRPPDVDAPVGPCAGDACLTVLANQEAGVGEIVADAAGVYWSIAGPTGSIRGCTVPSCVPEQLTVTTEASPHALFLDPTYVNFATGDSYKHIKRVDTTGTALTMLDANVPVTELVQLDRYVYFTTAAIFRCTFQPASNSCTAVSSLSGEPGKIKRALTVQAPDRIWGASDMHLVAFDVLTFQAKRLLEVQDVSRLVVSGAIIAVKRESRSVLVWPLDAPDTALPDEHTLAGVILSLSAAPGGAVVATDNGDVLRLRIVASEVQVVILASGLVGLSHATVANGVVYVVVGDKVARLIETL